MKHSPAGPNLLLGWVGGSDGAFVGSFGPCLSVRYV
jgi:hypothetical protein